MCQRMEDVPISRGRGRPAAAPADSYSMSGGDSSPYIPLPSTSRRSINKINECITNIEPVILTQRWTVNNFASLIRLSQPGLCLRSNVFRDQALPDACWQLCLYPGGKRQENANNVSLFLKMSATSPLKEVLVKAEYRFYFLDENDQPKFSNVNIGDFHAKPPKGGHSWGLRNIPKQKVQNSIRADNSLVISCTIELIPDVSRIPCKKVQQSACAITDMVNVSRKHLEDEWAMFGDGASTPYADMSIAAGPDEKRTIFAVHKYKLITHSDVFRAMLAHEMEESKNSLVVIPEFSSSAVKVMLEFIYCGTITTQELNLEDAADVMQLAEKYHIPALKTLCEQELIDKVTEMNVVECLELADTYQATNLTEQCYELMVMNKVKVMAMESWEALKERNPRLSNSVMDRMIRAEQSSPPVKKSRV